MKYNNFLNGYFLLNKPKGISSFWAISRARNTLSKKLGIPFKQIKVGHAGTLDPLAQGLLLCAVGKSTKLLSYLLLSDKKYIAELHLGLFSTTDDAEGEKHVPEYKKRKLSIPSKEIVQNVLCECIGKIHQIPPQYSALKIEGRRACDRVRDLIENDGVASEFTHDEIDAVMQTKRREVEIFDIRCIEYSYPKLRLEIHCGTGTYIRSLARDIGEKLQEGAYLSYLERTEIGAFSVCNAVDYNDITENDIREFDPSVFGTEFSVFYIYNSVIVNRLKQGQKIAFRDLDFSLSENQRVLQRYNDNKKHLAKVLLWDKTEEKSVLGVGEMRHNILIPRKIIR